MRPREAIKKLDQVVDIIQDDIEELKKLNNLHSFSLYMEALECVKLTKQLINQSMTTDTGPEAA